MLLAVVLATPVEGQHACVADCDGDGAVAINELVSAVGIALGTTSVDVCAAADADDDERVTIAELVAAVGGALGSCGGERTPTPMTTPRPTLLITGGCRRPGPSGLEACDLDTSIVAWRCDANATCIESVVSRTRLGDGGVQATGNFAFPVDRAAADRVPVLLEASVAIATLFRTMDLGAGSGAAFGRAGGAVGEPRFDIDPSSEAAVRLLDQVGLERFTAEGVRALLAAVAAANATSEFAGLDAEAAAHLAVAVALADSAVQAVLAEYGVPTPTPTPLEPTATEPSTPNASATASPSATATASQTASASSTPLFSPTATLTATVSGTPTRSATPTRTGTATRTPTRSATATRSATPTRSSTPTRTASGTATASGTVTATRTATPTRTPTHTPTPFIAAALTTDRGCIETGNNPVYAVGEQATLFVRVDGFSAGMVIAEAQLEIFDFIDGVPLGSIDLDTQPAGVTLGFQVGISPPTGTETLVLMAEGGQEPLSDQAQCSFHVVSAECSTACDCPPEQRCVGGTCQISGGALYCCTSATCPMGEQCQEPGGGFGVCG